MHENTHPIITLLTNQLPPQYQIVKQQTNFNNTNTYTIRKIEPKPLLVGFIRLIHAHISLHIITKPQTNETKIQEITLDYNNPQLIQELTQTITNNQQCKN